ncbi:hypothetical protein SPFL3102_03550 [Sporomusaceae bacterium FL31]|nr:hypothetical protein SPFL3101_00455 [Sporomusaceae bacterium FL31]GCE35699.1 hypothetical protein SPFL3102_03550 [Sporomusaceae bacterium]
MTNTQLKKVIIEATKKMENFTICVLVWLGDENDTYYEIAVYEGLPTAATLREAETVFLSESLPDTPQNVSIIKKEAQKRIRYLQKNVSAAIVARTCSV